MFKLEFATEKDSKQQRKEMARARKVYDNGIKSEYDKQRKLFPKGMSS